MYLAETHDLHAQNWNWFEEREQVTGRTWSENPYQANFVIIDEHCGTHFDAPTHRVPPENSALPWANSLGKQGGDKVPLEDLAGPAVVVDVRFLSEEGEPGESPFITPDHIKGLPTKIEDSSGGSGRTIALFSTTNPGGDRTMSLRNTNRALQEGEGGHRYTIYLIIVALAGKIPSGQELESISA